MLAPMLLSEWAILTQAPASVYDGEASAFDAIRESSTLIRQLAFRRTLRSVLWFGSQSSFQSGSTQTG